jgi:putative heme-binding domain-containing protein
LEGIASLAGELSRSFLAHLCRTNPSEKIRFAAVAKLAWVDLTLAATEAAEAFARGSGETPPNEVLAAILQRSGGAETLARALEQKPAAADVAKLALRFMNSIGRQESRLEETLRKSAGLESEGKLLKEAELKALVADVRATGDRKRGEAIFRRPDLSCLTCHTVANEGGRIGPDLNSIGTGQPLDFIIGAVLAPNKEIKEGYLAYEITTKDGEVLQGYKLREDNGGLVVRDVGQNEEVRLRADNIERQRMIGSLMPSGLVNSLTRAELLDLLRYLSELGTP